MTSPNMSRSGGRTADDQGHFQYVVPPGMRLTLTARDPAGLGELGSAMARDLVGGMTNVGFRPTVAGENHTIETYIFDFDNDIYGEHLTLRFREFIRPEQKFSGLPALIEQLKKDDATARALLS